MKFYDMILLGFANLWRTKLRTLLTTLGVVIGIGALTSMVSFGTGMEKNITDAFEQNDLFTSITVTPKKVDLKEMAGGDVSAMAEALRQEGTPLTDSLIREMKKIRGVELVYPNLEFPARITLLNDSSSIRVQAMSAGVKKYKPFDKLLAGSFFSSDTATCVVIREEALSRFKIKLQKEGEEPVTRTKEDSARGFRILPPDSIVNATIRLVSMSINAAKIPNALFSIMRDKPELPFDETVTELTVCGILERAGEFNPGMFSGGMIIPIGTAQKIPRLEFSSVWDLLDKKQGQGTYGSIHVRVSDMKEMERVRQEIEKMGVGVFSIADELEEIKRVFLVMDSLLGAVGAIALIVAGLGIINTMVMSILERTREIGIMKAIGGSENQIKMIFFAEAAVIGFVGAIFGLLLGWAVTQVANFVMNTQIIPEGVEEVDLFYFPLWLILGAIAFSILISLAAGLYPAIRAARIDPVKALRHD